MKTLWKLFRPAYSAIKGVGCLQLRSGAHETGPAKRSDDVSVIKILNMKPLKNLSLRW